MGPAGSNPAPSASLISSSTGRAPGCYPGGSGFEPQGISFLARWQSGKCARLQPVRDRFDSGLGL